MGVAVGVLAVTGAVAACAASGDEPLSPPRQAVADLSRVTDFTLRATGGDCRFDEDRGGLVYDGLTVSSKSTGALELTFYVQRDSLDDVLPGSVTTVLTFDADSSSHTFDLVIPVTRAQYDAGYDDCQFSTGNA